MKKCIDKIKKKECSGCQMCYNICPKKAITMEEDDEGFLYPVIDNDKCIKCGLCYLRCPLKNIKKKSIKNISYACYSKNDDLRKKSSSGGIFGVIALNILKENGVVFGASFNNKMQVIHTYVENEEDLIKLLGSKYVQSDIGTSYCEVKKFLNKGRKVLFSGTPCQVAGLVNYLGKNYDNLVTVDIICHGVPSPKVWNSYLKYRKNIDGENPKNISFRNKDNGWNKYNIYFEYNRKKYIMDHNKDIYMQSFLLNSCLRNSCYNCKVKSSIRYSDFTIGDFWGIDDIVSDINDDKGISLIILNTEKGIRYLKKIDSEIVKYAVPYNKAIKDNEALLSSVKRPKSRNQFIKNIENMSFEELFYKYGYIMPFYKKIILKIYKKIR